MSYNEMRLVKYGSDKAVLEWYNFAGGTGCINDRIEGYQGMVALDFLKYILFSNF